MPSWSAVVACARRLDHLGEVFDQRVGSRDEEALVLIGIPAHAIRRASLRTFHRENDSASVGLAKVPTSNNDAVADCCLHADLHGCP
jgi:hypothetical protein